ncbi:hypothetical protein AV521_38170 [Streptomyces sp. IMTB 2501]|uniref:DUF5819 family protein n=1 Tax=Streptomyces sp. IMTB 2501 TaxID=1776340 RepID=UPI00096D89D6|nr:DUF5819 family protein [Streptomyces sp. IMTB 2501]OLZ63623.1 hypothetical protein AV521_38170 [Streptomyces sp. IMTB 2501]
MDAYDEDSGARPGPDGSAGTRLPETPPARVDSPTGVEAAGGADAGSAGSGSTDDGGGDSGCADRAPRSNTTAGPATQATPVPSPEPGAPLPPGMPRTGVAALSPRYQVVAALALAVVGVAACVHVLMVFLSLAPANTVTKQHGKAVEEWVYPEFEQNWKLFAPNPLQQNIAVQVRAVVRAKDGGLRTTGWTDLSAQDGAAIDGNLLPSHVQQNELRRAWDFFTATHSTDNRSLGMRGSLSEQYLRRIVVMRLYRTYPADREGVIQRVQIRSSTTNVQPPEWSRERVPDKPVYRVLPWWTVTAGEAAGGVR